MSHRGAEGEKILAQIPMGQLTPDLLDLLNIQKFIVNSIDNIKKITLAIRTSIESKSSVGIVLQKKLWSS